MASCDAVTGVIVSALAALCLATSVRAAPIEAYGRLPLLEDVALSPDGSRIAFVRTEGNNRVIAVYSVADRTMGRGMPVGDHKLRRIQWADNDHLLITISMTGVPLGFVGRQSEWFHMEVYDLKGHQLFEVPQGNRIRDVRVLDVIRGQVTVRHLQDRTVLFVPALQVTTVLVPVLIRVDLETHLSQVAQSAAAGHLGWILDDNGEVAAEETYNEHDHRWSISIRSDGRMREAAAGQEQIDIPRLLGLGPAGDTLLLSEHEDGEAVWRSLSLKAGSVGAPLEEKKPQGEPIEDPLTSRVIGSSRDGDSTEYVFFDPALQRSWNTIVGTFPGERVRLESASANFHKAIVRVEGAKTGFVYALVDLDTARATVLGDVYNGITQPLEVRRITYAASDGLQIPAYLTVPRGREPKNLPLIVLTHGGPAAHDTADFDWWSQALADQGYAVLRPNYRGSDIDWAFMSRGFGEWGRGMQTDLSDGVRYLVKQGIADTTRVCIVGASYGGYAALAGASLDPGVYRCAVAVAGISDIKRMLDWVNTRRGSRDNWSQRYWDRFMGVSGPDDPAVASISPIMHLDAITTPVLLIHGKDDTVVPFEQSQVMYDTLHKQGKEAQLVVLKGEDHWLSHGETRLQMLQSSVAFLRAHNPPD